MPGFARKDLMEVYSPIGYNPSMQVSVNVPIELQPVADLDLGAFCKQTRESLGLSRAAMAEWLNVSYAAYEHYEAGRREPSSQVVAKLFILREKLQQAIPIPLPTEQKS